MENQPNVENTQTSNENSDTNVSADVESENKELREALTELGYKDPERLVLVRQQLGDAESRLKELEQHVEEAILEKEMAEELRVHAKTWVFAKHPWIRLECNRSSLTSVTILRIVSR